MHTHYCHNADKSVGSDSSPVPSDQQFPSTGDRRGYDHGIMRIGSIWKSDGTQSLPISICAAVTRNIIPRGGETQQ